MFFRGKPGPQQTIAKELTERKLKSPKTLGKCVFFGACVEIAANNAGLRPAGWRSNGLERRLSRFEQSSKGLEWCVKLADSSLLGRSPPRRAPLQR